VPIELGAELVHGSDTLLNRAIADAGLRTETVFTWAQGDGGPHPEHAVNGGCGYYYIGAERRLVRFDALDPELVHLNTTLNEMQTSADASKSSTGSSTASSATVASSSPPPSSASPPVAAQTVRDYLVASGCTPRTIAQAEAGYANTVCASLAWLPRDQAAIVMAGFEGDGENEWRCLDGYDKLLAHLRGQSEIWCNWPVARIEYGGDSAADQSPPPSASQSPLPMARIVSQSGECVRARRVVVTASVAALRHADDGIAFDPPLPEARLAVLRRLRMEPCLKVALKFRARFWPRDMHGMVCSDCVFPEMWAVAPHCLAADAGAPQNDAASAHNPEDEAILIFFAAAEFASRIGAMTRTQLRAAALAQLDQIFGNRNSNSATVATDSFVDLVVQDWTKERFVRGGYRYDEWFLLFHF
jgi:hypothetical protein